MDFKFCYQKRIRQRTERILSDVYDFCEASRFCNLTMKQYPRLFLHFEDRHINISEFFEGVVFKNEDCYWLILSDIAFARDIIIRDNLHTGLVVYLEALLNDLVEMRKDDSVVIYS
ncbi:hypothetical protein [Methylobacterium sp. GXS13]|uniref:hypothetical protein n=1 Tax=Methylobacterium sp. GXS13 TaxID=1730094 RepID=UPI000B0351F7|nr:hypothetical protein [Methylobacterium sp. GXS13]